MIEDKLTADERIRLEALSLAVEMATARGHGSSEFVLNVAEKYETYILDGAQNAKK
jgi:hypothetical protein